MKPSVIIALLVGGVVGFAVGNLFKSGPSSGPTVAGAPSAGSPRPTPAAPPAADNTVFRVSLDDAYVKGPSSALVTLVEFSDYQCPFCSRANGTVQQLEKDYEGKLRVVMKQHPLEFHPRARPSALAALAAGEQGKYWEMHDKLFANNQQLADENLEQYAKDLGLNVDKWKADLSSPKFAQVISHDTQQAVQLGANGTPAFFINGRKLVGARPIDDFKKIIDEELAKAQALVAAGTPADQVYAKVIAGGTAAAAPAPAPAAQPAPPQPAALRKVDVPADAAIRGPKFAKVTIVEWSDFQCPFCGRVTPTLKQVEETYGDKVRLIFRHQPLPFHPNAKPAAEASLAAAEQGKFWQYHDKLFANQQNLDRASLEKYAGEVGLDVKRFKAALDSGKFTKRVEEDSAAGAAAGANGTPTFFINGREFVGAQPFESFKNVIDEELKKADAVLAKGVKLENLYAELQKQAGNAPPPPAQGNPEPAKIVTDINVKGAPVKGPQNAPVTIVEFSDFQCPFCGRVVPTLQELEKTYQGKVKVIFKHQPLSFHPFAKPAAVASMAAAEQGKFWQMHDKLFANQQNLDRASLEKYAGEIGLDLARFRADLDSSKFEAYIAADSAEGMRVGANGTPTFFINGRQVVGAVPIEQFKTVIDEELKKAR
jgi:protein-disulfide isomerase